LSLIFSDSNEADNKERAIGYESCCAFLIAGLTGLALPCGILLLSYPSIVLLLPAPFRHPQRSDLAQEAEREAMPANVCAGRAYIEAKLRSLRPMWRGTCTALEISNLTGTNLPDLHHAVSLAIFSRAESWREEPQRLLVHHLLKKENEMLANLFSLTGEYPQLKNPLEKDDALQK
jgi:hypothetical protein